LWKSWTTNKTSVFDFKHAFFDVIRA